MQQVRELERIYAQLPKINCKKLCTAHCGPILCSELEEDRVEARLCKPLTFDETTLSCSALKGGLCSAYEVRPLICRLFGVAEGLLCPHGCVPERILSKEEARQLIRQVCGISQRSSKR